MKTLYSTEAQTEILFARNQRDLSLDDLKAMPAPDDRIELVSSAGARMASFTRVNSVPFGDNLAYKIKSWCVKNGYRCTGVRQFEQFKTGAL